MQKRTVTKISGDGTRIDLQTLIALRQEAAHLELAPRGKVLATRSGGHLSHFRGRGVEFDESRVYLPGDDPRNMDWRVTARTGRAHVKMFREERERPVWLLVDSGPRMHFGTRVAFKSVIAAQAAALLAWSVTDKGDRVGGLVFNASAHVERRPMARTAGLLPLLKALADTPLQGRPGGYGSMGDAAAYLAQQVRPGSLVFLLSDFAGLSTQDGRWLARLGRGSEVVLVHIFDPIEVNAPPAGLYPVSDDGRLSVLNTARKEMQLHWHRHFSEHQTLLTELARQHHAHLLSLRTDQPVGESLHRGLLPRQQLQRLGR